MHSLLDLATKHMGNKLRSSGKYRTETVDHANRIDTKAVWDALEHQPSDRVFSRCGVVKFVIDLGSDPNNPTPYFLQSKVRAQSLHLSAPYLKNQ